MINFILISMVYFSGTVFAQSDSALQKRIVWVLNNNKIKNVKIADGEIQFSKDVKPGLLNIRSRSYGKPIEVYNTHESMWVSTQFIYSEDIVLSSEQTTKMKTLSDCDKVAEIVTEFVDSSKFADVYVDGYKYGSTGKHGVFKKKTGANCKGDSSEFSLRKVKCDSFIEKAVLTSSPFFYKQSKKFLKCKK